jgi:hypothetical protein
LRELSCVLVSSCRVVIVRSECQEKRQIKREQLEYTVTEMNQLTYEIKEEIKRQAEEVENKVNMKRLFQAFP